MLDVFVTQEKNTSCEHGSIFFVVTGVGFGSTLSVLNVGHDC